ncbi:heavy metal-binding domain-containing protein [Bizionia gelidisalsuginis]|uniref:Heavy metal-binding domain-containing protein n=2 Tax=Bizionia TaxID=283785 RepID=A0A8H2QLF8_9FLAO|nr:MULTISPECIES: heavy metal-binding domain-containing protein [Bizionia]TYB74160.1 heavy metal-binding domain-containing protein [Bizionia saleffrena]TYC15615.1 heavy metal-binding domain-containing protein [Bizionia gelidisalsuginis]
MIVTTTASVEGYKIIEYKGLVSASTVHSKVTSFMYRVEKFLESMEDNIDEAKQDALEKLQVKTQAINANAIVGVTIDMKTDTNTGYILLSVTGTAVTII